MGHDRPPGVVGLGIGLAVSGGLYIPAVAATVIILIILAGIKPLERRFIASRQLRAIVIYCERDALSLPLLHEALGPGSARVGVLEIKEGDVSS